MTKIIIRKRSNPNTKSTHPSRYPKPRIRYAIKKSNRA